MKHLMALAMLPCLAASLAAPLAAQDNAPMSYDDRITCGALLFLSAQEADDPSMEQQFAAHHLSKAIESSGKTESAVVADAESRVEALAPAWARQDMALAEAYSNCITTVISEFEG